MVDGIAWLSGWRAAQDWRAFRSSSGKPHVVAEGRCPSAGEALFERRNAPAHLGVGSQGRSWVLCPCAVARLRGLGCWGGAGREGQDQTRSMGLSEQARPARMVPGGAIAHPSPTRKLGRVEMTVLSDGRLTVPTHLLARNVTDAEIKSTIGLSNDTVKPPCNVTLVRTPSDTILIDVGAGLHFMAGAGNLCENMAAAGSTAEPLARFYSHTPIPTISRGGRRFRRHTDVSKCVLSNFLRRIEFLVDRRRRRTSPQNPTELRAGSQTKSQAHFGTTRKR
jgi:hypothetical protein